METVHAQTKCQWSSTSGRAARASYQTMFHEISAPCVIAFVSEVEDACGQAVRERNATPRYVIPFIYSARFVQFLYVCSNVLVISFKSYVQI